MKSVALIFLCLQFAIITSEKIKDNQEASKLEIHELEPLLIAILKSVSFRDVETAYKVLLNFNQFNTTNELFDFVEAQNPNLYKRVEVFVKIVLEETENLSPEFRNFTQIVCTTNSTFE